MPAPNVGDAVENFTLQDQDGQEVSLTDFKASPVILFFYPRADTPGCTIEACGFRDTFEKLQKAGAIVLGISRDDVKSQKKFAVKYDLPYPLLADPDMKLIDAWDLVKPKNMYGKLVKGVERTTYVIAPADKDDKQRLLHVYPKVKPEGHAEEVLALIKANKS
jgi:peroxiredoxin Q/BCP